MYFPLAFPTAQVQVQHVQRQRRDTPRYPQAGVPFCWAGGVQFLRLTITLNKTTKFNFPKLVIFFPIKFYCSTYKRFYLANFLIEIICQGAVIIYYYYELPVDLSFYFLVFSYYTTCSCSFIGLVQLLFLFFGMENIGG